MTSTDAAAEAIIPNGGRYRWIIIEFLWIDEYWSEGYLFSTLHATLKMTELIYWDFYRRLSIFVVAGWRNLSDILST